MTLTILGTFVIGNHEAEAKIYSMCSDRLKSVVRSQADRLLREGHLLKDSQLIVAKDSHRQIKLIGLWIKKMGKESNTLKFYLIAQKRRKSLIPREPLWSAELVFRGDPEAPAEQWREHLKATPRISVLEVLEFSPEGIKAMDAILSGMQLDSNPTNENQESIETLIAEGDRGVRKTKDFTSIMRRVLATSILTTLFFTLSPSPRAWSSPSFYLTAWVREWIPSFRYEVRLGPLAKPLTRFFDDQYSFRARIIGTKNFIDSTDRKSSALVKWMESIARGDSIVSSHFGLRRTKGVFAPAFALPDEEFQNSVWNDKSLPSPLDLVAHASTFSRVYTKPVSTDDVLKDYFDALHGQSVQWREDEFIEMGGKLFPLLTISAEAVQRLFPSQYPDTRIPLVMLDHIFISHASPFGSLVFRSQKTRLIVETEQQRLQEIEPTYEIALKTGALQVVTAEELSKRIKHSAQKWGIGIETSWQPKDLKIFDHFLKDSSHDN